MIEKLDIQDNGEALRLLELQLKAYRIEAELIGMADIPPLMESVFTLRQSGETFYGCKQGDTLAGAVSIKRQGEGVTICRLMVHPDHFRKGIASRLLEHVQRMEPSDTYRVSTGTGNEPAVALYRKHGFVDDSKVEAAPGVTLTSFVKRLLPDAGRS